MDGIANHFPAKNALDCSILHTVYNLNIFTRVIPPDISKSDWTQIQISAWLASVPIVPVMLTDHWLNSRQQR